MEPERAHHFAMRMLGIGVAVPPLRVWIKKSYIPRNPKLERTVFGIRFPNPVGLAAGFDKDARYIDQLACLGFGFIEIGTVTPRPQPGNPRPRLFRLPRDKGLINRMGFNNAGAHEAAWRLRARTERVIIGGNIGKNKDTPNEHAAQDYEKCFRELYDVVDYFVINISSPNTPGLRDLQQKEPLLHLLQRLQAVSKSYSHPKPLLLKIAPDLTNEQINEIVDSARVAGLAGIVATNTTVARTNLATPENEVAKMGPGGLSGAPLRKRSTEIIRQIHDRTRGELPIIASGGIFTGEDAQEKISAGASLVQIYSGFIYEGPGIVRSICEGLAS